MNGMLLGGRRGGGWDRSMVPCVNNGKGSTVVINYVNLTGNNKASK